MTTEKIGFSQPDPFSYSNIAREGLNNSLNAVGSFSGSLLQAPSKLEKNVEAATQNAFASGKDAGKAFGYSLVLPGAVCVLNNAVKFAGRLVLALFGRIAQVFVATLGLCSNKMSQANKTMNAFLNKHTGFSAFGNNLKGLARSTVAIIPGGLFALRGLDKAGESIAKFFEKPLHSPEGQRVMELFNKCQAAGIQNVNNTIASAENNAQAIRILEQALKTQERLNVKKTEAELQPYVTDARKALDEL